MFSEARKSLVSRKHEKRREQNRVLLSKRTINEAGKESTPFVQGLPKAGDNEVRIPSFPLNVYSRRAL